MALIREFFKTTGRAVAHPTAVECGWQVVDIGPGERLLQLSTYGSDSRASHKKVSQTLQLDADGAARLRSIIEQAFPAA